MSEYIQSQLKPQRVKIVPPPRLATQESHVNSIVKWLSLVVLLSLLPLLLAGLTDRILTAFSWQSLLAGGDLCVITTAVVAGVAGEMNDRGCRRHPHLLTPIFAIAVLLAVVNSAVYVVVRAAMRGSHTSLDVGFVMWGSLYLFAGAIVFGIFCLAIADPLARFKDPGE